MRQNSPPNTGRNVLQNYLLYLAGVLLVLSLWQLASILVGLEIILPAPIQAAKVTLQMAGTRSFWESVGATVGRGLLGFFISLAAGLLFGGIAGLSRAAARLLEPAVSVVRSTPVMSVILLALIWFPVGIVPVFVAFLMAFPVIYTSVAEGIRRVDTDLLEMSDTYRVPRGRVMRFLYLPSIYPYFASGSRSALGLTWKVVVAAEVLSQPTLGIGAGLQEARALLLTSAVFAWTLVAVVLSGLSDALFFLLTIRYRRAVSGVKE